MINTSSDASLRHLAVKGLDGFRDRCVVQRVLLFPQGLGGLQSLDLSLNGLSSVPLGLLDELQSLR